MVIFGKEKVTEIVKETKQDKLISHVKTFSDSFTNHEKKIWKLKIQELVDDFDRK